MLRFTVQVVHHTMSKRYCILSNVCVAGECVITLCRGAFL